MTITHEIMIKCSWTIFPILIALYGSCMNQWDSSETRLVNDYVLSWVDHPMYSNIYHPVHGKVVDGYVFAVGFTPNLLYVKRHPIVGEFGAEVVVVDSTEYYIVLISKKANPVIKGPLTRSTYMSMLREHNIISVKYKVRNNPQEDLVGVTFDR